MTPAAPAAVITRPQEDAGRLADALLVRRYRPLIAPLLRIEFLDGPALNRANRQALLVTSSNGARALQHRLGPQLAEWLDLPVWAVGDSSAAAARAIGFRRVTSADGNVEDLARRIIATLRPQDGHLLQVAASDLAGDLSGLLTEQGFAVERQTLYRACPATSLPDEVRAAWKEGSVRLALFFSPRSAATFVSLAQGADLASDCDRVVAVSLSDAVDRALAGLPWKARLVAARPRQDSLLAALDGV